MFKLKRIRENNQKQKEQKITTKKLNKIFSFAKKKKKTKGF